LIFEKFNVTYVKGRFSKPGAVTGSKEVGVIIERYRKKT
jgi:dihydroneopterin aldolase